MQRIALEFPSYGWPRMTEELKRRGWAVNHKRVYRLHSALGYRPPAEFEFAVRADQAAAARPLATASATQESV